MKLIYALITVVFIAGAGIAGPVVARVNLASDMDLDALQALGAGILHAEIEGIADIVIDEADADAFRKAGFDLRDIVPLSKTGLDSIDPEYHIYEEYATYLDSLAAAYPNLCRLDTIGQAQQVRHRVIWSMKVSDNPNVEEDEPAVLYIGVHHACEVMGGETLLYMIGQLLSNYGIDPVITRWVNDYEIFFVPLLNPDGNYAVTTGINYFWRKNARDLNRNGVLYEFTGGTWWNDDTEGIDLNRNYDWHWIEGGSGIPRNYYYRGHCPFSEAETQAIRDLGREQKFVCGLSFHSYGDVVIYPWDFNGAPAPDQDVFNDLSLNLSQRFLRDNGSPFSPILSDGRSGQCRNWFYGSQGGLFFCVELMPYPMFIAPGSQLAERTQRYYNGCKYLLERMSGSGITGHLRDGVTGQPLYGVVDIQQRLSTQVPLRWNDPHSGRFTRLLNAGTYTLIAGARGYRRTMVENVTVTDTMTQVEIFLTPLGSGESAQNSLQSGEPVMPQSAGTLQHNSGCVSGKGGSRTAPTKRDSGWGGMTYEDWVSSGYFGDLLSRVETRQHKQFGDHAAQGMSQSAGTLRHGGEAGTLRHGEMISGEWWVKNPPYDLGENQQIAGGLNPESRIPHPALSAHPNPFNQHSLVSLTIELPCNVRLAVYDVSGREAAVLAEGYYGAGEYEVVWDASGMASGVYFIRCHSGGGTAARKVLLIK